MAEERQPTLAEEAGLGPGWEPIDVEPIRPGRPSGAPPVPNQMAPYYSGSIAANLQHDTTLVGTKYGTPMIASLPLTPLGAAANPAANAAIISNAPTPTPTPSSATKPAPPDKSVQFNKSGVFGGTSNFTFDYNKTFLELIGTAGSVVTPSTPTIRNFTSWPPGNGDATYGPGGLPLSAPDILIEPINTQTGNTMVVFIAFGTSISSVTDNAGNTYTSAGNNWWYCSNATGITNYLVTATALGQAQYPIIFIWEVVGAATVSPVEQTATAAGAVTLPTIALTTTNSNDLILVGMGISASSSAGAVADAAAGWTLDNSYTTVGGEYIYTPSANNGVTPYAAAEHNGISGIFSGNVTFPIASGPSSYTGWSMQLVVIKPQNVPLSGQTSDFVSLPSTTNPTASFTFRGTGTASWWGSDRFGNALTEISVESDTTSGNLILTNQQAGDAEVSAAGLSIDSSGSFFLGTQCVSGSLYLMSFQDTIGINPGQIRFFSSSIYGNFDFNLDQQTGAFYTDYGTNLGMTAFPWGTLFANNATFLGSASGSAAIGAAAAAGSANRMNLPLATGTAGQFLTTDGANPQQLSWASGVSVKTAVNLTAQGANVSATTALAVSAAGLYRVTVYMVVSQAATSSSTLPDSQIIFTDEDSSATITVPITNGLTTNTTSTFAQATFILNAKASTNIQYAIGQVTAFASSGATSMQFAYRLRIEAL